eukprot:scaffold36484_cov229-Amphora_coffeaeformis.AAC.9
MKGQQYLRTGGGRKSTSVKARENDRKGEQTRRQSPREKETTAAASADYFFFEKEDPTAGKLSRTALAFNLEYYCIVPYPHRALATRRVAWRIAESKL